MEGRIAACLAMLALFLQVAVPPGFMVGRTDSGPAIVICTGHGPLQIGQDGPGKPGKPSKATQAGACVFAGHGGFAPPPGLANPASRRIARIVETAVSELDLLPGRGLAAPPPPSQGPPSLTI